MTTDTLPVLETVCPECGGIGTIQVMYQPLCDDCPACDGAGYIPTALGKRFLELMEHNFRPMHKRMTGDDL